MAEIIRITHRGYPVEIIGQWLASRGVYEVVFWLNPDSGIPTGHKTFNSVSPTTWGEIKRAAIMSGVLQYSEKCHDCGGNYVTTFIGAGCQTCGTFTETTSLVFVDCPQCLSKVMIVSEDGARCVVCEYAACKADQVRWIESSSHGTFLINGIGERL